MLGFFLLSSCGYLLMTINKSPTAQTSGMFAYFRQQDQDRPRLADEGSWGLVSPKANRTLTIKGRSLGMGRHGILLRNYNYEATSKDQTWPIGCVSTRV